MRFGEIPEELFEQLKLGLGHVSSIHDQIIRNPITGKTAVLELTVGFSIYFMEEIIAKEEERLRESILSSRSSGYQDVNLAIADIPQLGQGLCIDLCQKNSNESE